MWEFFSVFFSKQVPLLLISTSDVHLPTRRQLIISRTDSPMFAQIHYKALMPTHYVKRNISFSVVNILNVQTANILLLIYLQR